MPCGIDGSALGNYVIVADAGSRPTGASRYPGVRIFQSDNGTEYMWDGTGWVVMSEPVRTWTPTKTNLTLGNGTETARYQRQNGRCKITWKFTLGSTSAVGSGPVITLPIAPANGPRDIAVVPLELSDASVARYGGLVVCNSGSDLTLLVWITSGTALQQGGISNVSPFTWATGDYMSTVFDYEMTTRYS